MILDKILEAVQDKENIERGYIKLSYDDLNNLIETLNNRLWKEKKQTMLRALYQMIEAHEKQGLKNINIAWLRDYVDDIAVHYPERDPEK